MKLDLDDIMSRIIQRERDLAERARAARIRAARRVLDLIDWDRGQP